MTNILKAVLNISQQKSFTLRESHQGNNRANNMGEALETFIKDAFASTIGENDRTRKLSLYNKNFSFLGNKNNPPDLMIKNGDAIEIKKINSSSSSIALNSSYPKATLKASNPMITKDCKECEQWKEKDLIYCVGHTNKQEERLISLWMFYGSIYAAEDKIYSKIKEEISKTINSNQDVDLADTKELAKVKKVDPLGITDLRVRGMWHIQNPRKVFDYIYQENPKYKFQLITIIPDEKIEHNELEKIKKDNNIKISKVNVKSPNNPARLIKCHLIIFSIQD